VQLVVSNHKTCRVVTPPNTAECGKPARCLLTFADDDQTTACEPCALYLSELAKAHGTIIKVVRLP
jgi:hypothetical protein